MERARHGLSLLLKVSNPYPMLGSLLTQTLGVSWTKKETILRLLFCYKSFWRDKVPRKKMKF
jgi:hypothetical protein